MLPFAAPERSGPRVRVTRYEVRHGGHTGAHDCSAVDVDRLDLGGPRTSSSLDGDAAGQHDTHGGSE